MKLKELIKGIRVAETSGNLNVDIKDIAYDSRQVSDGVCFVAIKGEHADGHDYIDHAIKNKAAAIVSSFNIGQKDKIANVVVEETRPALARISSAFFGNPSRDLQIIGVTGTNGKTTISFLVEAVLKESKKNCGVIGTVNWRFAGRELPAPNTTPMSYELHKLLAEMRWSGVGYAVIEVSSHALDQFRVAGVNFDAAVFTNLTHDHLDYHENIKDYFRAKHKLFTEYLAESEKKNKIAAVNIDDEHGRLIAPIDGIRFISYGFDKRADVSIDSIDSSLDGNILKISTSWGKLECKSGLKGRFNASNVLAAVSVMGGLGYPLDVIKRGVESLKSVPGRMEDVPNNKGLKVFVDYSHTPDALKNALATLKEISKGSITTVFGCGGDRDRAKRPIMGEIAARFSDRVVVTSDNPRSENPLIIINEIVDGIKNAGNSNYTVEPDRQVAIEKAIKTAKKGDVILIAGKGHEDYQIVGKEIRHFDDKEEARKCLNV